MAHTTTKLKPLNIDLTGKTADEIYQLLRNHGFSVEPAQVTGMWDNREIALHGRKEDTKGDPVRVLFIKNEEAPLLTVTIFNGKIVTLEPGDDLHLFDRPKKGHAPGKDWAVVHSMNVMR